MMVPTTRIRAALRIERRLHRVRMPAQAVYHVRDHVVGADPDAVAQQLHGQVAVAQVPGDAHQLRRGVGVDFQQRFGLGDHADDAAIVQAQPVAVPQAYSLWQVEQEFVARLGGQYDAAAVAAVEIDEYGV